MGIDIHRGINEPNFIHSLVKLEKYIHECDKSDESMMYILASIVVSMNDTMVLIEKLFDKS